MVARSRDGSTKAFPVVETIHRNSILLVTEAPAHVPEEVRQRAQQVAESAVACLDGKLPRMSWFMRATACRRKGCEALADSAAAHPEADLRGLITLGDNCSLFIGC